MQCPKCGSRFLRPSRTRNDGDGVLFLRFKTRLRCMDCKTGFIAPLIDFDELSYARCPVCHRMDLNGWTGKTYTDPPFWVKLKVALGASKWRCEYCRLNFASFRQRKEIFTFKRWKRYVPQAEERPVNNAKIELIAGPYGEMIRNALQTPAPESDADSPAETE